MTKTEGLKLKPGDKIRLNAKASEWARPYTFEVERVNAWGVNCSLEENERAVYRATWEQIEAPQMRMGAAETSEYPD